MRQADSFSKSLSSIMMMKTHLGQSAHDEMLFGNPLHGFVTFPLIYLRYGKIWIRDSSVGIATRYGLDGPRIESFHTCPDRP